MDRLKSNFELDKGYWEGVWNICKKPSPRIRNNADAENWSYCPTEFNPADFIMCVGNAKNFIENKLWSAVPEFLKLKKVQMFEFWTEVRKNFFQVFKYKCQKINVQHV